MDLLQYGQATPVPRNDDVIWICCISDLWVMRYFGPAMLNWLEHLSNKIKTINTGVHNSKLQDKNLLTSSRGL